MKNARLRITLVLLVVGTAIFGLWSKRSSSVERSDINTYPTVDTGKETLVTASPLNSRAETEFASERSKKLRLFLESENVLIVFWGKVVDEMGTGIPGASIKYHVQRSGVLNAAGSVEEDVHHGVVTSGVDGSFEINQIKGMSLAIEGITKPGHTLLGNQKLGFSYTVTSALHKPDHRSPQVYVMGLNETRPDVRSWQQKVKLRWNDGEMRIDSVTGQLSPSGNIVLIPSRNGSTGRFDWNLKVTLQDGELSEAIADTALIAPENGYIRAWQCGFLANDKDFQSSIDTNVYYRLNGKYGRLKFLIYSDVDSNDVSLYLESFVNNSGGRNTEGDQ